MPTGIIKDALSSVSALLRPDKKNFEIFDNIDFAPNF